jgi:hypothetical protein
MMKSLGAIVLPALGILVAFQGSAEAGNIPRSAPLTDTQMDKIAAGTLSIAIADGNAQGNFSTAETKVSTTVSSLTDGTASGQVTAFAIGTAGSNATASATLSLSVSYP